MLLGGRVAEEIIYADPTTGAANDIEKATSIARKMVMEYGMSDELGPMQYGKGNSEVFLGRDYGRQQDYSDEVAAFIDGEVRKMITAAHDEAKEILNRHRDAMERMVSELMDHETVGSDEVASIFEDVPKWEHAEDGLRVRYPLNPVPHPGTVAAASRVEPEEEETIKEVTVKPQGRRARPRPDTAEA
jgi:cell division protease FtsH